jgi:hypothetical protein
MHFSANQGDAEAHRQEDGHAYVLGFASQQETAARLHKEIVRGKSTQYDRGHCRTDAAIPCGQQNGEKHGGDRKLIAEHWVEQQPNPGCQRGAGDREAIAKQK